MKKAYEVPSVDVVMIDNDIICTSGCENGTPVAGCPTDI